MNFPNLDIELPMLNHNRSVPIGITPSATVRGINEWPGFIRVRRRCYWQYQQEQTTILTRYCYDTKDKYPFGFNGMLKDNEMKGIGNSLDFGARMLDTRVGRWFSVDPLAEKYPNQSSYLFCNGSPILYMDPDGRDGVITIKGDQVTISSNIFLYGAGATKAIVTQYQSDIDSKWGGTFSAKFSSGNQFNVNVKVNVGLYKGKEKSDPWIIPGAWNPNNLDNFIEVGADKRSYVTGGDEGEWRARAEIVRH